jgi:hypothetical protein
MLNGTNKGTMMNSSDLYKNDPLFMAVTKGTE